MKKVIKWILMILLTMLILVVLAGMYKFNYLASKKGYNCDGNKIETPENLNNEENIRVNN